MSTFSHCCESMRIACDDPDYPVVFKAKFREYAIKNTGWWNKLSCNFVLSMEWRQVA